MEDMTAGKSSAVMPSFTDMPAGADKFSITLAAPFGFFFTMIPLTFASAGTSPSSTGPYA